MRRRDGWASVCHEHTRTLTCYHVLFERMGKVAKLVECSNHTNAELTPCETLYVPGAEISAVEITRGETTGRLWALAAGRFGLVRSRAAILHPKVRPTIITHITEGHLVVGVYLEV